jgi:hypothetical protein
MLFVDASTQMPDPVVYDRRMNCLVVGPWVDTNRKWLQTICRAGLAVSSRRVSSSSEIATKVYFRMNFR